MQYPVALQLHNFISVPSSPEPNTPLPENTPKVIKITNCRVLKDHKIVEKDAIWIQDGKIIDPHKFFWYQKRLPDVVLDAEGLLVAPGFIEAQINGNDTILSLIRSSLSNHVFSIIFLLRHMRRIRLLPVLALSMLFYYQERSCILGGQHCAQGGTFFAALFPMPSVINCDL